MKRIKKYVIFYILLFFVSAGFFPGCGARENGEVKEIKENEKSKEDRREDAEEKNVKTLLSFSEGEIRSMWMEEDVLYVFAAFKDQERPYEIYEVKDGGLSRDTPYGGVMEQWLLTEMKSFPASSYEYEARLGRNGVVYLLGRDEEGAVKRCYWMEKSFYTDILFYEKYEGIIIGDIGISRTGKIYLENVYGGSMIRYDDFYGSIGFGVSWDTRKTVLGERRMYQFTKRWIYVWDIPSGASLDMIKCDVLNDSGTPVFIDKKDGIYLVGENGLAYLADGGSVWEILVHKDEAGFSDEAFDLKQIWVCEEELYLLRENRENGSFQILKRTLPGRMAGK